jgi:hypothetical protein
LQNLLYFGHAFDVRASEKEFVFEVAERETLRMRLYVGEDMPKFVRLEKSIVAFSDEVRFEGIVLEREFVNKNRFGHPPDSHHFEQPLYFTRERAEAVCHLIAKRTEFFLTFDVVQTSI